MSRKILYSLSLLLMLASTGLSLSKKDIYDYWNFNKPKDAGSSWKWETPSHTSGMNPTITVGSNANSKWQANYGFGFIPGHHDPADPLSGNGSMFANFKQGGEVKLTYNKGQRPSWRDEDGMSLSMLVCNGNSNPPSPYSASTGFYFELQFADSSGAALKDPFHFAFEPVKIGDEWGMTFGTNLTGTWTDGSGKLLTDPSGNLLATNNLPLPPQDKLLPLVMTFTGEKIIIYLDGQILLQCTGWDQEQFASLYGLQVGGLPPSKYTGLTGQQMGTFTMDELTVWNKALNKDEVGIVSDPKQEIEGLPAVPEPSTALLASVGIASLIIRRRRS